MCEAMAMQEGPLTRRERLRRWWRAHRPRAYQLPFYGVTYRTTMKLAHRFGWHYAPPKYGPDPDRVYHWCHWCGLRYDQPASLNKYKIKLPY